MGRVWRTPGRAYKYSSGVHLLLGSNLQYRARPRGVDLGNNRLYVRCRRAMPFTARSRFQNPLLGDSGNDDLAV